MYFTTIKQEAVSAFKENSNSVRAYIVDVSIYQNYSYTAISSQNFLLNITIPVENMPKDYIPECIYLDLDSKSWLTTGCILISKSSSSVVCSCSHLSTFSIRAFFKQAGTTAKNSNIEDTYKVDTFKDINSVNASGVYFVLTMIFVYFTTLFIAYRKDNYQYQVIVPGEVTSINNVIEPEKPAYATIKSGPEDIYEYQAVDQDENLHINSENNQTVKSEEKRESLNSSRESLKEDRMNSIDHEEHKKEKIDSNENKQKSPS